ncbi:uncharacterized protein LOC111326053 [Stylophora pistillata]|uniref:uncharacterized protein LOC111326053 n=1 Tax=Stylophora pistillata TaxID=50429 RepID=UPI000C056163|nr:uncharacterized protein LOC111326053 [Stylophora pistillata]
MFEVEMSFSNFNGNYHDHRGQVQNEADSETNVQGSGDSPSNALLTETWETSDEIKSESKYAKEHIFGRNGSDVCGKLGATIRRGVTCDVSECSGSGELENPCASAEEEMRKNQWQSHRNKCAKIRPDEVYIEAEMPPFCIQLKEILKEDSGTARFKGLRDVKLQKVAENIFFGRELPKPAREGLFKVAIESRNGDFLGETEILYKDANEEKWKSVVINQDRMRAFLKALNPCQSRSAERSTCDTLNTICAGPFSEQKASLSIQLLLRLLYKAAEVNAKWFIHLIFTLPAGRIAFESYKEIVLSPEIVASAHGHEEIAQYLGDVRERFSVSEEGREGRSNNIDWQEIMDAMEATETAINIDDQTSEIEMEENSAVQDDAIDRPGKYHLKERLENTWKDASNIEEEESDLAQEIATFGKFNI